jgi:hypothetical protein
MAPDQDHQWRPQVGIGGPGSTRTIDLTLIRGALYHLSYRPLAGMGLKLKPRRALLAARTLVSKKERRRRRDLALV